MMWGESGARNYIRGDSVGAWILRVLLFAFLSGGALAVIVLATRFLGVARAEDPVPVKGLGKVTVFDPKPGPSLVSGALIMPEEALPDAFDAGWKSEKVCEPLFENDRMRAARCAFPPGVGHEKHRHAPHWGYVVSGATMRIVDKSGTNDRVLATGGSWWSDGVEWHEALNVGATTGVYVIVEPKGGVAAAKDQDD